MTILGNIFLTIATLIFFLFAGAIIGKEPPKGGDGSAGYVWAILIFNLVFLGCMVVIAFSIGAKGGFDWISADKGARFWFVAIGLLGAMVTSALSGFFKGEPGPTAAIIRSISGFVPLLIPLILIVTGAILLNDGLRLAVPVQVYKIPLIFVFGMGVLGLGAGVIGWMIQSGQNAVQRAESIQADQLRYHQNFLNEIDSCDVSKDMSRILVFTDANHDPEVRRKAIEKIRSNSQWQQELVRLLENDGAIEAFEFLASNEIDDKTLFIKPVNSGILSVADWIRQQIRKADQEHHFYPELFSREVERILRTVDKLADQGADFRPAVHALRAALDEPNPANIVKLNCISMLDNWIKKK